LKRSIPSNQLQDIVLDHYNSRVFNHRNFLTFLQWTEISALLDTSTTCTLILPEHRLADDR
jgi:hypothetical protein